MIKIYEILRDIRQRGYISGDRAPWDSGVFEDIFSDDYYEAAKAEIEAQDKGLITITLDGKIYEHFGYKLPKKKQKEPKRQRHINEQ